MPPLPEAPSLFRRGPFRYLADIDVWHSLIVTALACVLSGGILYLVHFVRVARVAARATCMPDDDRIVLVFGRRLSASDAPEIDYAARLQRALDVIDAMHGRHIMLLGGASGSSISEAASGLAWLRAHGLPDDVEVTLEQASIDSLENLRHARSLLGAPLPPVALINSRYHLARCLALANALGFPAQTCAAEPCLHWNLRNARRIALEAGYLMWQQTGTAWARLIRNKRMLARVT